jgi:hypothetical protein
MAREGLRQDLEQSFHLSDLMISFKKSEVDPTSTSGSSKAIHGLNLSERKGESLRPLIQEGSQFSHMFLRGCINIPQRWGRSLISVY